MIELLATVQLTQLTNTAVIHLFRRGDLRERIQGVTDCAVSYPETVWIISDRTVHPATEDDPDGHHHSHPRLPWPRHMVRETSCCSTEFTLKLRYHFYFCSVWVKRPFSFWPHRTQASHQACNKRDFRGIICRLVCVCVCVGPQTVCLFVYWGFVYGMVEYQSKVMWD